MTSFANREPTSNILALSGGVGGAKLVLGLSKVVPADCLTAVANTGDDFEHLGFSISPDIDTLMYTLAGLANSETGWGRRGESWSFMSALEEIGGETWFRLGDKDLAIHTERTRRLHAGERLSEITHDLCQRLGVGIEVVPMSDSRVRTTVQTSDGPLAFQHYFVRERCTPAVAGFNFDGAAEARPAPAFMAALTSYDLAAIVICPSNPFISIDPILAVPGVRQALIESRAPVVAVSPVVNGRAIKGPTTKMMEELGLETSALSIARHYGDILDGFVIDRSDGALAAEVSRLSFAVEVADTIMTGLDDKIRLARFVLKFAESLRSPPDSQEGQANARQRA